MMNKKRVEPPVALKTPRSFEWEGREWADDYFWMRLSDSQKEKGTNDPETKKVLDYLEAENEFLHHQLEHTEQLQQQLFDEMKSRVEQRFETPPVERNGYLYATRFEEGQDYPLYVRWKKDADAENKQSEVLLNGPELAKDENYFQIAGRSVSPDNNWLVYGVDTVSRRQYKLCFKQIPNDETLAYTIQNTTGNAVWANDNKTIFYTVQDTATLRPCKVYKHRLGEDPKDDELVFHEKDETFICDVRKSKSGDYIFIESFQSITTETQYIRADFPDENWKSIVSRQRDHEYSVFHYEGYFYYLTNLSAINFQLMRSPVENTDVDSWEVVVPHNEETLIEEVDFFNDFRVMQVRKNGLTQLIIKNLKSGTEHIVDQNDPAYTVAIGENPNFNTSKLRFVYTSMTTPISIYEYDMETQSKVLLKQKKVVDPTFKADNYQSERIFAVAEDGTDIPVSLVYKKDTEIEMSTPLLLYGYGSYGISMDPYFSSVRLSLLNRGFVFAIAHVRGGEDMGRKWYEQGKLLQKRNTFSDFIAAAEMLVERNYTSTAHLYAQGGSAGGLLMGAVMNMRPELFNGVLAGVPFVDVINTMMDESIPLTTGEFDEWGNPKDPQFFDYIQSYSPYDNVGAQDYPHLLITTGFWDSQVQYWEPAKWIAKLREYRTNDNLLLMYCNMDVGHGGASGRFQQFKEVAMEYAFLLHLENKNGAMP